MAKRAKMVEYGYNEAEVLEKGTLLVLDSFEEFVQEDLEKIVSVAEDKKFTKIVLFPHTEKTLKSMGEGSVSAYHARVKQLVHLVDESRSSLPIVIDKWEEKRKKYTPMELILRYFEESYKPPLFLYLSDRYANAFSAFASFEECIKKVRLLVEQKHQLPPTSRLEKFQNRWDYV
jgi:nicotinic acid mononucleotide adenylyltransferase